MMAKNSSRWQNLIVQWKAAQSALYKRLIVAPLDPLPRFVAGADAAFASDKKSIFAVAVVYDRNDQKILEVSRVHQPLDVPYLPGFLSFREGPAVQAALQGLRHEFGVICFDGQGLAHPRRCGLACHVSITLDRPGVGIAKSRLIGEFVEPRVEAGSFSPLTDDGETVGNVLRTRANTKPIFVSVGHRIDLTSARALALACCKGYRIPEPTRQADIEVARFKAEFLPRI